MANEIRSAYESLASRFRDAAVDGGVLDGVQVLTGLAEQVAVTQDTLPSVRLFLSNIGRLEEAAVHARAQYELGVTLRLREDPQYGAVSEDGTRGIIVLLQKVLNALDSTDLAAGGAWGSGPLVRLKEYRVDDQALRYDLEVTITTPRFTRGGA